MSSTFENGMTNSIKLHFNCIKHTAHSERTISGALIVVPSLTEVYVWTTNGQKTNSHVFWTEKSEHSGDG